MTSFNPPFFILGCVRSGTTLLRNLLRQHPHLACPEETHFFRWAEPFGGSAFGRMQRNNEVLQRHRQIDGISEEEFEQILEHAHSRADLCERYMQIYVARNKPAASRWFDKTPQNVYGAALIASSMPSVRFVHIVRNPVNVVASLRIGAVIKVKRLMGACNYWTEAIEIISLLRQACPERLLELRYEDLTTQPEAALKRVLDFVGEPFDPAWFAGTALKLSSHQDSDVLNDAELLRVRNRCSAGMRHYGYL
ncbi:MAG TPA: sulfotransferase [Ideonella sp.]|uniref:sulfotransferase family protein n=1 Tax=Ideonella sp. TaxID=1929293 RepID=UPI002C349EAC|nr:sulfotransferase [Ideonella sp.]HSI47154.1 sulfotransferase [Ideonella sp.]